MPAPFLDVNSPFQTYYLPSGVYFLQAGSWFDRNLSQTAAQSLTTTTQTGGGTSSGNAASLSAFYVTPNGFSGSIPAGYTQVAQDGTNTGTVSLSAGINIVQVAAGCTGTVSLVANSQPFTVDTFGAGLSSVSVKTVGQ